MPRNLIIIKFPKFFIYPGYLENPTTNSGADFAMVLCYSEEEVGFSNDKLPSIDYDGLETCSPTSVIGIWGFPGDKKEYQLWGMTNPAEVCR